MIIKYIKTIAESWIRIMQNFSNQKIKLFLIVYLGVVTYIIFHITGQMYGRHLEEDVKDSTQGCYCGSHIVLINWCCGNKLLVLV